MKKLSNTFFIALLTVAASACADSHREFRNATLQYCELYNPDSWGDLAETGDTYSIYNAIVTRQESEIDSKRLKEIITSADTSDFAEYYKSIHSRISKALGDEWNCDYFEQFFMPSQTVISLSLNGVHKKHINPNGENTIVITVVQSGKILLGNAPLVTSDQETLLAAIQSRLGGKPVGEMEFVLYFDENGKGDLAPMIFGALSSLGVKQVNLIGF